MNASALENRGVGFAQDAAEHGQYRVWVGSTYRWQDWPSRMRAVLGRCRLRQYPRAACSRFWTCSGHLGNARSLCLNPDEIVDHVPSAIRLTSDSQAAWIAHCGGLRDLRLGVWRQTGARDWPRDPAHPSGSNARPLRPNDVAGAPARQGRGQVG